MTKVLQDPYKMPKHKVREYKSLREKVIDSGVQYAKHYNLFDEFVCKIDTDKKRKAIKFILGDLLEITELNYEYSIIIHQLGDIDTKEELSFREFKLSQQIINSAKFKGRENHIRLAESMQALNEDGKRLMQIEQESSMFAQDFQKCGNEYNTFCQKNDIMPEALDNEIDKLIAEEESK